MDDARGGQQLRAGRFRTVRARAPAAKAVAAVWAGLRGLVAPNTWALVANVALSLIVGAAFAVALAGGLLVSGLFSWIVGIGSTSCGATLRLGTRMARFDRRRIARLAGEHIDLPSFPETAEKDRRRDRTQVWIHSPEAWRLVGYQFARLPVAVAAVLLAFGWWRLVAQVLGWWPNASPRSVVRLGPLVLALACVLVWPLVVRVAAQLDLLVARWLLPPSHARQLTVEVERLGAARGDAVAAAESERRRIERDLHDGLQPRLVSLALDLGLAEARFERDPTASRSLIARAHGDVKIAIEDLRSIVRGIHPSVLDGRGLDAALSALVASCPLPVTLHVEVPDRPDALREAAAYYVVAESVTNAQKHAGADSIAITVQQGVGRLHIVVEDDGAGGARFEAGGGLAGLAARVRSIDGTLTLSSPPGGPTRVEAMIPCER